MKKHLTKIVLATLAFSLSLSLNLAYAEDAINAGDEELNRVSSEEEMALPEDDPSDNPSSQGVNNATSEEDEISNAIFDVSKVLKLDGQDQPQAYFNAKDEKYPYPPIISFILRLLDFATSIIGSIAIILLIVGGYRFMIANGNQQKIDEAKDMVKFTLMGLVFTFLSYVITIFLQSVFIPE